MHIPMQPNPCQDRVCDSHPRKFPHAFSQATPTPPELTTVLIFHHMSVLLVLELHVNGMIQYVLSHERLLSLSLDIMFEFILLCVSIVASFLLLSSIPSCEYVQFVY